MTSAQPQLVRKLLSLCLVCRLPDFGVEITGPSTMAIVFSTMILAPTTPHTASRFSSMDHRGGQKLQPCSVSALSHLPPTSRILLCIDVRGLSDSVVRPKLASLPALSFFAFLEYANFLLGYLSPSWCSEQGLEKLQPSPRFYAGQFQVSGCISCKW